MHRTPGFQCDRLAYSFSVHMITNHPHVPMQSHASMRGTRCPCIAECSRCRACMLWLLLRCARARMFFACCGFRFHRVCAPSFVGNRCLCEKDLRRVKNWDQHKDNVPYVLLLNPFCMSSAVRVVLLCAICASTCFTSSLLP